MPLFVADPARSAEVGRDLAARVPPDVAGLRRPGRQAQIAPASVPSLACFRRRRGEPTAKRRAKKPGKETPEEKSKRHAAMEERVKKRLAARAALT